MSRDIHRAGTQVLDDDANHKTDNQWKNGLEALVSVQHYRQASTHIAMWNLFYACIVRPWSRK